MQTWRWCLCSTATKRTSWRPRLSTAESSQRTVCVVSTAQVDIPDDFYKKWAKEYMVAWNDVKQIERQKDGESNLIDDLISRWRRTWSC